MLPLACALFDHIKMESFNVVSVKQSINKMMITILLIYQEEKNRSIQLV